MTELVEPVSDGRLFLIAVAIFGLAPGVILRLVVRAYPRGHQRREELLGELYAMNWASRPFWVAQQLETAIFEGIPARRARMAAVEATDVDAAVTGTEPLVTEATEISGREIAAWPRVRMAATSWSFSLWSPLTPTEMQIVDLVAQGLSNRQIAKQLFLGIRSVEAYMPRIFTKLGVTSLPELRDALQEQTCASLWDS